MQGCVKQLLVKALGLHFATINGSKHHARLHRKYIYISETNITTPVNHSWVQNGDQSLWLALPIVIQAQDTTVSQQLMSTYSGGKSIWHSPNWFRFLTFLQAHCQDTGNLGSVLHQLPPFLVNSGEVEMVRGKVLLQLTGWVYLFQWHPQCLM